MATWKEGIKDYWAWEKARREIPRAFGVTAAEGAANIAAVFERMRKMDVVLGWQGKRWCA